MIGPIVSVFSSRCYRPRFVFRFLVQLARVLYAIKGRKLVFDAKRFERAAWISSFRENKPGSFEKSLELVVVSASKDFDILPSSVDYAIKALSAYQLHGIRIIVPERDMESCRTLFSSKNLDVEVVNESDLVSPDQFRKLTEVFKKRNTWVLQQLLKVSAVQNSKADAVLILDSDTVLLRPRPWFSSSGSQILMPSFEFNSSYYEFLNTLGMSEKVPEHTFISHHMIMQPLFLNHFLEMVGLASVDQQIDYICEKSDPDVQSPICIEYELYGQSLTKSETNNYFLERWANLSVPRKNSKFILNYPICKKVFSLFYNSISFHSWS